ncbi:CDP-glycerol glycerophosphotransferase (TagB/SpsB family) [Microcella alkaliphila]|uniref:CDP-glycerol glycerophosphotransferase (TagB/SpsB family) n=1 Tax=Microcella alkaliphila TaxID=279828 RepID=A0A4Q7TNR3_9MICO|nr:CDP-glycerol glycerophosphotransferase family protein [Microcella alkaliphila]RZT62474.1 CDP-glycerol glycerophosphotransferase (TagB/SpsB family) [Microcella alkaliphila]
MASFTFSAGNARVLARAPLYAAGWLAAAVVPRSSRRWVYGSGIGLGEGALALYDAAVTRADGADHLWLASSATERDEARARGMRSELKRGPRGLWATLRARVVVITHGAGDVNRFGTRGATVVQLWHGIPLKRLHLDTSAALSLPLVGSLPGARRLMAALYRRAGRGISLFPVASELVATRIRSGFGIPAERVVALGEPRDDVLTTGDAESRRRDARGRIEAAIGALPAGSVVLYAPTWRDGALDPAIPSEEEWAAIAAWCERTDTTLLVRSHPLGAGSYAGGPALSARVRLIGRDVIADVTPVIPALDAIVTDYSSIAFDGAIAGVPSVFFAPDVATYLATRGLYMPYAEFTGGRHVTSWRATLDQLDQLRDARTPFAHTVAEHTRWLRDEHVDHPAGGATVRVLEAIDALVAGRPVPAPPLPDSRPAVTIDRITLDGDALRLEGSSEVELESLAAVGPRMRLEANMMTRDGRLSVSIPLVRERWGRTGLAPVSGTYRLQWRAANAVHESGRVAVTTVPPSPLTTGLMRCDVASESGGLVVRVAAPLTDDERAPGAQRQRERAYRRARPTPENAVMFESFYSQSAACNPLAIDRELAARRPDVPRYWSVVDRSVAVPDGAIAVVEGSDEWWRVRAAARLIVVNDWMRKRWKPRPHQRVLQTWHGTMLKRLALDRDGVGLRTRLAVRRESRRWDVLLAQNDYAAEIFRRAYAFTGPLWVEGYPRDDVLVSDDREAIRRRIGLRPGQRAVLYAPTWRDDADDIVDYLDLPSIAPALDGTIGIDHVVLVRGHSRTLRGGADRRAPGLIDVTTYPDMSELLVAADVIVTDYSSIMFDAITTEAPLVLFTPDLEKYREQLRGFYFDVTADFPGPTASDRDALLLVLATLARGEHPDATVWGRRRADWRARFAPLDDGHASARVVDRIFAEGMLD